MGNTQIGSVQGLRCMPRILQEPGDGAQVLDMEEGPDDNGNLSALQEDLESAVIHNDLTKLQNLLEWADVNLPLNDKRETALILAVRLSHVDMVELLLGNSKCNKNHTNVSNCSPLDIALITTFDNRCEPRHSVCWQVVALLLEAKAEPACKDAMMYVIRTALKFDDTCFINHLIDLICVHSSSLCLHELLLQKLHRLQPMSTGSYDQFLENSAEFSIKLIRGANHQALPVLMASLTYYLECHWDDLESRNRVIGKIVLYSTAAGWSWHNRSVAEMTRVHKLLAQWCRRRFSSVSSLSHLARKTIRRNLHDWLLVTAKQLALPHSLQDYILLKDVDEICAEPFLTERVNSVQF